MHPHIWAPHSSAETYSYSFDTANRLTSAGGQTYAWDDNGNLLSDGVRTYQYDHANRLKQVTEGSLTTQFAYNGDGVRVGKTIGAATTDYLLDLAATLPVVISDTDALYLYGLDIIAEQLAGAERYYYVHDGLGSVRHPSTGLRAGLLDSTGQIQTRYAYDPFGVPLAGNGMPNPWHFTGEAWDAGVELLYLRARYYQPETGRFITKDPWPGDRQTPDTLNRYVYVANNPVNLVDATGLNGIGGPHPILGDKYDDGVPSASKVPVPPGYPDDFVDHRDLTIWLVEELSVNAQSPEVSQMRRYLTAISKDCPFCVAYAGVQWTRRVADRHVWDFKHQIKSKLGEVVMLRHFGEHYDWYEYSVPGNVHYGYVGRAAGWSAEDLHWGASFAEMTDPVHKERGEVNSCFISRIPCNHCPGRLKTYRNPEWEVFGYDNPEDWNSVEFGIRLHEAHPVNLTLDQFRLFLFIHGHMLTRETEPSDAGKYHPEGNSWPYWRGYFNGPRTDPLFFM